MEIRIANSNSHCFEEIVDFLRYVMKFDFNVAWKVAREAHKNGSYPVTFSDDESDIVGVLNKFDEHGIPYLLSD